MTPRDPERLTTPDLNIRLERNISKMAGAIETPFQWTSNRKWRMGYLLNGHVTDDVKVL